jgi:hypothetical protein
MGLSKSLLALQKAVATFANLSWETEKQIKKSCSKLTDKDGKSFLYSIAQYNHIVVEAS